MRRVEFLGDISPNVGLHGQVPPEEPKVWPECEKMNGPCHTISSNSCWHRVIAAPMMKVIKTVSHSSLSAFLQRLHVCLSDEQPSRVDAECVPNCLADESRSGRLADINASSQFMYIEFNLFASAATVIGRARLIMLENDHGLAP